jgi:4-alpha-glucanotransferase
MTTVQSPFSVPFPPEYRASGVLLHVASLPSRFGIGDVGPSAFAFVDRLAAAGQSWWQLLPMGPTGYSHSPYQSLSSFAANPSVISPDRLIEDGLLQRSDCENVDFSTERIDYDYVIPFKERLLTRAWNNFHQGARADLRGEFTHFTRETAALQDDPALFMALRKKFGGAPFQAWPADLARREPTALARARQELDEDVQRFRFGQFMVLRHWKGLKDYARQRGVRLLGDLPIFVSPDSSDVWANPELFLLDENLNPTVVAGVPPDYFSVDGQLWGNPLYHWEALKARGYRWWIERFQARLAYVDAIRLDHFRGFEAAWHVPAGAATAAQGAWVSAPGVEFFTQVRKALGGLPLFAEDLGDITPAVTALRDQFGLPGMRVLQFGFSGDAKNPHLPHNGTHNALVYTGTHDNNTTRGWYDDLPETERAQVWKYLERSQGHAHEVAWELIRLAWMSHAALAITPVQDLLGLGATARMNIPGRADGQWRWRCPESVLTDEDVWLRLRTVTAEASRLAVTTPP